MAAPKPDSPEVVAAAKAQIDATLAGLPADQRDALGTLRATIAAAAPEAVEGISYGLPAFRYRGRPLVSYHAAKAHCSFFPMGSAVLDTFRGELSGFDTAKGTIRFTPDHPIPSDLVTRIVRARVADLDAARGAKAP
jgi:uncharacterized protein YdhG (YjbR/CyaY superfamily)